ncbi:MAG: flagellar hook-basal body protein [Verrucomicrobiota bacterium]
MLRSLSSGVSGIQQFQGKLDVIGNNIANSSTLGFKAGRADFEDAFSQTMQTPGPTAGVQLGNGVTTGAVRSLFQQGTITKTGLDSDMAIDGDGFFSVKNAATGQDFVTRAGDFRVDSNGYLVTNTGLRVQGYSDAGLSSRGDILIDATGKPSTAAPDAIVARFSVDDTGKIKVKLSDGTEYVRGQILLQRFQDPNALMKEGNNLFSGMVYAGPLAQSEVPGTNGLGSIRGASIEQSNVDLANEFASMITTQRGFQASARIITTSDEMLQELVNLKR